MFMKSTHLGEVPVLEGHADLDTGEVDEQEEELTVLTLG